MLLGSRAEEMREHKTRMMEVWEVQTLCFDVYPPSVPSKVKFAAAQQCWHWLRRLVTVGIPCQSAKALLAHMARCRCAIYDRKCVIVINHMGGGGAVKVLTAWVSNLQ